MASLKNLFICNIIYTTRNFIVSSVIDTIIKPNKFLFSKDWAIRGKIETKSLVKINSTIIVKKAATAPNINVTIIQYIGSGSFLSRAKKNKSQTVNGAVAIIIGIKYCWSSMFGIKTF